MPKKARQGSELCFSSPQEFFSALFSRRLALMSSGSGLRNDGNKFVNNKELIKAHSGIVDDSRIAFDCIDAHWD